MVLGGGRGEKDEVCLEGGGLVSPHNGKDGMLKRNVAAPPRDELPRSPWRLSEALLR